MHAIGRLVVAQHPDSSFAANLRVGVLQLDDPLGQEIEDNHARADRAQADLFSAWIDHPKHRRLVRQAVVERRMNPAVVRWRVVLVKDREPAQHALSEIADKWLGGFQELLERTRLSFAGARGDQSFEGGAWSNKTDPTARVHDGEAHHVPHVICNASILPIQRSASRISASVGKLSGECQARLAKEIPRLFTTSSTKRSPSRYCSILSDSPVILRNNCSTGDRLRWRCSTRS